MMMRRRPGLPAVNPRVRRRPGLPAANSRVRRRSDLPAVNHHVKSSSPDSRMAPNVARAARRGNEKQRCRAQRHRAARHPEHRGTPTVPGQRSRSAGVAAQPRFVPHMHHTRSLHASHAFLECIATEAWRRLARQPCGASSRARDARDQLPTFADGCMPVASCVHQPGGPGVPGRAPRGVTGIARVMSPVPAGADTPAAKFMRLSKADPPRRLSFCGPRKPQCSRWACPRGAVFDEKSPLADGAEGG